VGTRAGLDRCGKSRTHGDSIQDRRARSQSLHRLNYPAHKGDITMYNMSEQYKYSSKKAQYLNAVNARTHIRWVFCVIKQYNSPTLALSECNTCTSLPDFPL